MSVEPSSRATVSLALAHHGTNVAVAIRRGLRGVAGSDEIIGGIVDAAPGSRAAGRVLDVASARRRGALELIEVPGRDVRFAVLAATDRGLHVLSLGDSAASDQTIVLAPPARGPHGVPLVVPRGPGAFAVLWTASGQLRLQFVLLREAARVDGRGASTRSATATPMAFAAEIAPRLNIAPPHPPAPPLELAVVRSLTLQLPHGTVAVSAAAGPADSIGLIVRTAGRHFVVAVIDHAAVVRFPGNAPAGCDRGRCQPVALMPARDGFVAGWSERPLRDGLRSPGARSLAANGHVQWAVPSFIPMSRAAVIAGPDGQPFALQLGRPIILRGGLRPVAIPSLPSDHPEYPTIARSLVVNDSAEGPRGLLVAWASPHGPVGIATLACPP